MILQLVLAMVCGTLISSHAGAVGEPVAPPRPYGPVPSARQLRWHELGTYAFLPDHRAQPKSRARRWPRWDRANSRSSRTVCSCRRSTIISLRPRSESATYLVDPDTRTFDKRIHEIESHGGRAPFTVQDIRRVLDDKNVDVVSIATPNHWHALMTIWAAQAGKDVYVEKPCSHNIHEGRIAALAARRYQRIVQHGTQSRSSQEWALAAAAVQSGKLGKLLVSRALCYKPRGSIGIKPSATPPAEVDFNPARNRGPLQQAGEGLWRQQRGCRDFRPHGRAPQRQRRGP